MEPIEFLNIVKNNENFISRFTNKTLSLDREEITELLAHFENLYAQKAVEDNTGGAGPIPSFWYYLISKWMQPEAVIESGVWKGHTTWLFRSVLPQATIHSFDISLKQLVYKDTNTIYHENDWGGNDFTSLDPLKTLVFFDDHISHAQRVSEAYSKGFKYLILDDGVNILQGYELLRPAFPTIQMFFDPALSYGKSYNYSFKDQVFTYYHSRETIEAAKALVDDYLVLGNTYTAVTLVILK